MTPHRVHPRFTADHPYRDALAGVATKHEKTPILAGALSGPGGLRLSPVEVDTDVLGTFTGDVPRRAGPAGTAIAKARLGIDAAGHRLGLASEGTFGAHPVVGFLTVQTEIVAFVDAEEDLVVLGHAKGAAPWTRTSLISPGEDLDDLVRDLDPPRHTLVARPEDAVDTHQRQGITKGIGSASELRAAVHRAASWSRTGQVRVETDLRAHRCRLRHPLIRQAAQDLAKRLSRRCARCGAPGFGRSETVRGAPCRWCGAATSTTLAVIDTCPACGHAVRHPADSIGSGDPATCPECNP